MTAGKYIRLIILAVLVLLTLGNEVFLKRLHKYREKRQAAPSSEPFVSILIPARNEEDNIRECVLSLLRQDYPSYEVLVLDDDSTDATPAILRDLGPAGSRLQVLNGRPLPPGWLGKHWACHQLAQMAQGDLLLFTDADTRHHPQMLHDAVAAQQREKSDLLTGLPREKTGSLGEALVIPIINWAMFSLIPWPLAHHLRSPVLSMGIGQFMLFTRSAYWALGGFEAVRTNPVDDVALARRAKELGLCWRFVDLSQRVECRMYSGFRETADGFGKIIYPVLGSHLWALALGVGALAWLYLGPLVEAGGWLLGFGLGAPATTAWAIGLAFFEWALVLHRAGQHWYQAVFYPVTVLLTIGIGVRSALLFHRGEARWKGRTLPAAGDRCVGQDKPEEKLLEDLPPQA